MDRQGQDAQPPHPLLSLPREDLDLILELVLNSGSLKDVAQRYTVSYPTIRIRLDKTIQRLRDILDGRPRDPFAELLADLLDRGEVSPSAARTIRDAARALSAPGPAAPRAAPPAPKKGARP